MDNKKIGEMLLHLRGDKTQKEIAEAVGVSQSAIRQYETGNRIPRDVIKENIAKLYNKTVQEIFYSE